MSLILDKKHKKIIDAFLLQYPYQFYAYGSRAKGSINQYSDLDLCLMSPVSGDVFAHIKYGLSQLMLPFGIDLIAWQYISDEFKKTIQSSLIPYTPDLFLSADLIDLSHQINSSMPTWDGRCGLQINVTNDYDQTFRVQKITMNAGLGTHLDVPAHIIQGGLDCSQITSQQLQAPCTVMYVDIKKNPDFILTRNVIEQFEAEHGKIIPNSWFLVMFGWGSRWHDAIGYRNADAAGTMHFPKIDGDAAELFIERQILGIGVDTLSPDGGDGSLQLLHKALLPKNIFILENLKFVENLPIQSGYLLVSHLPIVGGTESPARVVFLCHQ